MVPGKGFEPLTFGLQNRCTTTVLTRLSKHFNTINEAPRADIVDLPPNCHRMASGAGPFIGYRSHASTRNAVSARTTLRTFNADMLIL